MTFWRSKRASTQDKAVAFDLEAASYARFENVGLEISGRTILQDLSLQLNQQRIGLVGLNGSGKSSFVRLLNGLRQPTSGRLEIFGADAVAARKDLPRHVGFVFQNPDHQAIFPTVEEDVAFGLRQLGEDDRLALEQARDFLSLHGASHLAQRPIAELSEGQKQLVCILAVLIMQPSLIILDEPYSSLDALAARRLHAKLESLPQKIVMISHDPSQLEDFDRVVWIEAGGLRADGAPGEILKAYDDDIRAKAAAAGVDDWDRGHL
ncbi:ABC transporter ATP-binding protein [Roseibium sp. CAU 1637]|uniref:ABC transporter ATP-binding protein n=1 Tax=Roseibium limicola TaxID=2816037 RepID=A0A939ETC1_9HYPH|nr:ABC transporter ATP-binding protein [Roseibium limicola]MBO0347268.1 ABC transporter ATP-binding protein [Roseibium limicola]